MFHSQVRSRRHECQVLQPQPPQLLQGPQALPEAAYRGRCFSGPGGLYGVPGVGDFATVEAQVHPPRRHRLQPERVSAATAVHDAHSHNADHGVGEESERPHWDLLPETGRLRRVPQPANHAHHRLAGHLPGPPRRHCLVAVGLRRRRPRFAFSAAASGSGSQRWSRAAQHQD